MTITHGFLIKYKLLNSVKENKNTNDMCFNNSCNDTTLWNLNWSIFL